MSNRTPLTERQRIALSQAPSQSRQSMATMFRQQNRQALVRYNPQQMQVRRNIAMPTRNPLLSRDLTLSPVMPTSFTRRNRRNPGRGTMSLSRTTGFLSAPVMSAAASTSQTNQVITISRCQFFASNVFDSQNGQPFQVDANDVIPSSMPWFNGLCELYDEYRFRSISVRYMGAVSTATSGRAFMYFEYNRSRVLPESLQQAQAGDKFTFFPHWSNPSPTIQPSRLDPNKWYKTDVYALTDLGGQTTYSDSVPVTLVTGFDATQTPSGLGQLGDYELDCTIQFRGPRPISTRFKPPVLEVTESGSDSQNEETT